MRYGPDENIQYKIKFEGKVLSVQPRSNVWRYRLDNRTHTLTGYNIFLEGTTDENLTADGKAGTEKHKFAIAVSEKQQEKLHFHIGDEISGTAWTKKYPKLEYADYYRAGALKKTAAAEPSDNENMPPWTNEVPALSVYDWRGCRMLDKRSWSTKCFTCKWAAMANVAIEYNWGISRKFRFESFCYGPFSCKYYKMGKPRAVPDKQLGSVYDEGWLDEICTENRKDDDE